MPQIADVRGLGAMVAVEFNQPGSDEPDADFTKRVQAEALQARADPADLRRQRQRGALPVPADHRSEPVFDEAMEILRESLRAAAA